MIILDAALKAREAAGNPVRVAMVVATTKTDLRAGQVPDGIGGYTTYGRCENADVAASAKLLPMGLVESCTLRRNLPRDTVLTYEDVEVQEDRLCDRLRREQDRHFLG